MAGGDAHFAEFGRRKYHRGLARVDLALGADYIDMNGVRHGVYPRVRAGYSDFAFAMA